MQNKARDSFIFFNFNFIYFLKNSFEIQLIYNVMLVLGVQQSDSVLCICIYVY